MRQRNENVKYKSVDYVDDTRTFKDVEVKMLNRLAPWSNG